MNAFMTMDHLTVVIDDCQRSGAAPPAWALPAEDALGLLTLVED